MRPMGKRRYNHGYKYLNFIVPEYGKWNLLRDIGKQKLSKDAQLKLEWIIFYHTLGRKKVLPTAKHFGINPKTLHKWKKRFKEDNLLTLEEISRKPKDLRTWTLTSLEIERVKHLRREYIKLGKKKLKLLYQERYKENISTWKIERVIRRYALYPNKAEHGYLVKRREQRKPKIRIHMVKERITEIQEFGFLWHSDSIVLWWNGRRIVIFTGIEQYTRIAYARIYPTNSSSYAEDFLKRLLIVSDNKIRIMHSDNGSEFKGDFEKICKTLGILQIYSRAYTPKDNAMLERFNRTIQEEWLSQLAQGLDDMERANDALLDWLIFYNSQRPHQALDYKTPLQYAHDTYFKVLPMWPASTTHLLYEIYMKYFNYGFATTNGTACLF